MGEGKGPGRPLMMRAAAAVAKVLGDRHGFCLLAWDQASHVHWMYSPVDRAALAGAMRAAADKIEGPRKAGDFSGALPPLPRDWAN